MNALIKKGKAQFHGTQKIAYLFLAPWLIGIVLFSIVPMIMSLGFSFTDYDMFTAPNFIGLANYQKMFLSDTRLLRAVSLTVKYVVIGVPCQLAFALFLAVVLSGVPGVRIFRAVYYVPSLLGGSVAVSFLWRQIFGMDGLINKFLAFLGNNGFLGTFSWINEPKTAVYTIIILLIWQFGSCMVIFVAAIKNIPQALYEAAEIDGAGSMQKFWSITFPMLTPILFFNLIMQIISAFQAFTPAFVIGKGTGGFRDSILFYTLYLYLKGFFEKQMGYASAMAWFLLVVIGVIAALLFATQKFWVFYEDDQ